MTVAPFSPLPRCSPPLSKAPDAQTDITAVRLTALASPRESPSRAHVEIGPAGSAIPATPDEVGRVRRAIDVVLRSLSGLPRH